MNLNALIADAKQRSKAAPKRGRQPADKQSKKDSYTLTKEELRKLRLDRCKPVSVHLRVTHQTCTNCGNFLESVNNTPLVKRVGKELTHYEPWNALEHMTLPRFIEIKRIEVSCCPECFARDSTHTKIAEVRYEPCT